MSVMKFGGSSIATSDRIRNVVTLIVKARRERGLRAVVCSAFGGTTDSLIQMARKSASRDSSYREDFAALRRRHHQIAKDLISVKRRNNVTETIEEVVGKLSDVLHGIFLVRELTPRTLDFVMSFGERLSNFLVSECVAQQLNEVKFLDTRSLIKTNDHFGAAIVDLKKTELLLVDYFKTHKALQIATGFVGSTDSNETTTLGRGGSDLTISLIGAALDVVEIEIWTDVDGIMTADPEKVTSAFPLGIMSYEEAMEMSHFGAKVIYPPTMAPAMAKGIPLRVKNTLNPTAVGTLVTREIDTQSDYPVAGISSIDEIALIQLKGCGMIGVSGIAARLFGSLAREGINMILISQASSEHAICVAIRPESVSLAKETIENEFSYEMLMGQVDPVSVEPGQSIIAVVGENMRSLPGVAGRVFSALGEKGVNVSAIAQGSSERNISFVVDHQDETKALNAIHSMFFGTAKVADTNLNQHLHVFIAGPGLIGRKLMDFLAVDKQICIRAVCSSQYLWEDHGGVTRESLHMGRATDHSWKKFIRMMDQCPNPKVFVDCTAGDKLLTEYTNLLSRGISVVTPNKQALTSDFSLFTQLTSSDCFHFEANVGAGLPILSTIRLLQQSGDRIHRIEAVLSGTLSYLFNEFDGSMPFSSLVKEARLKGLTEPHPGDDLNGMDAARKILILARLCGLKIGLDDIDVENLVPVTCIGLEVTAFLEALKEHDDVFEMRRLAAGSVNKKLRYLAEYDGVSCRVGLKAVEPEHPAYALKGTDNLVLIYSDRYCLTPLVIQGPGAGPAVTAGQLFAEIMQCKS